MKQKSIPQLKKKLWELTKQIIRKKHGNTCFCCGAKGLEGSNWHTGHFIPSSIGGASLRYNLDNLRPCCYRCNIHLSGNWPAFFENLTTELGKDRVDILMALKNRIIQADRFWYETKIEEYQEVLQKVLQDSKESTVH